MLTARTGCRGASTTREARAHEAAGVSPSVDPCWRCGCSGVGIGRGHDAATAQRHHHCRRRPRLRRCEPCGNDAQRASASARSVYCSHTGAVLACLAHERSATAVSYPGVVVCACKWTIIMERWANHCPRRGRSCIAQLPWQLVSFESSSPPIPHPSLFP